MMCQKDMQQSVDKLENTWRTYIQSDFSLQLAITYCDAYLELLHKSVQHSRKSIEGAQRLLSSVLGFENFILEVPNKPVSLIGATASFRNPIFLCLQLRGYRKNNRNDPSLLPLIVANTGRSPSLFYHYRKQRVIKNNDDSLLFFPAAELNDRPSSFHCYNTLEKHLAFDWDSRVQQRSKMLVDKVLAPLLHRSSDSGAHLVSNDSLRILDIGSGSGQFTSTVVNRMLSTHHSSTRDVELTLMDVNKLSPSKRLQSYATSSRSLRVEYVSGDYRQWLSETKGKQGPQYDFVFLFRILHNMSRFKIGRIPIKWTGQKISGRYPRVDFLSNYFQSIGVLFPEVMDTNDSNKGPYVPLRLFNDACLTTVDGRSAIGCLSELARGVVIEDSDLTAATLTTHMARYDLRHLAVYDLSQKLRLSVNHVYWIGPSKMNSPWPGANIWPN